MALGGVYCNSACQCLRLRSELTATFNVGAIGTGLIIGSSTALVRGMKTNRNSVMVHRTEFSRRACWSAHRLCHSWCVCGLTNRMVTEGSVNSGVDWYRCNIAPGDMS